ncbi:MAG: TetR/AcrR family transcriptional regulator [Methyloligellaceae bacterium]
MPRTFAPSVPVAVHEITSAFEYAAFLDACKSDRARPKRERSRAALFLAAESLLKSEALESITVESVVQEAGFSRGTFYQYFKTTDELLVALLNQFFEDIWTNRPQAFRARSVFEQVYVVRLYYAKSFEKNAHLFYFYKFFSLRSGELGGAREKIISTWLETLERRLRVEIDVPVTKKEFRGLLRAGGILWVEMLVEYFLANDAILHRSARSVEDLTNLVMLAWHRLVYGCDPLLSSINIEILTGSSSKKSLTD